MEATMSGSARILNAFSAIQGAYAVGLPAFTVFFGFFSKCTCECSRIANAEAFCCANSEANPSLRPAGLVLIGCFMTPSYSIS